MSFYAYTEKFYRSLYYCIFEGKSCFPAMWRGFNRSGLLAILLTAFLILSLLTNVSSAFGQNYASEGVVEKSGKELKVYKGVWLPALVQEFMYGKRFHSMSDVETLRADGVNIIGFPVRLVVNKDGSLNVEGFHINLQFAKQVISFYHREGFAVFLTLEVTYAETGEPVPVPRSIVEKPDFIEQYDSLVLELAQVAEEYDVELFAPTLEPDHWLGDVEFAAEWCREILPKVREYYNGKLMVRLAFDEITLQQVDFNIEGYDVLGICIYQFEDGRVSRDKVKLFIDYALKLASKYGVPQVTTEFGIWGEASRISLSEELKAEAIRVVFEEGEGKLSGFFIFDILSPGSAIKGSAAESVIREWYTTKLSEETIGETQPTKEEFEAEPEKAIYRFGFVGPGPVEEMNTHLAFIPHIDLGFRWDRPHPGPFIWDEIEPVKGSYDFSKTDLYVQTAQQYGIQVMATIWPYAEWDQEYWRQQPDWQPSQGFEEILPESRYKPHDLEAYKKFVKALVERYDGDGVDDMPGLQQPIKYWEVLNEPEMGLKDEPLNFFRGSPADYLEIVKATYEAVKEADPEAKVLNGGIAYVPKSLSEWDRFWGEFFNLGGGQYIDIVTFHQVNDPHVSTNLERLKNYLETYGVDKPIWLTELQIPEGYIPTIGEVDEEKQADLLVKAYIEGFAGGIEKIFYTSYLENPLAPETLLSRAALIKADGTPKKAYYALKSMILLLEGFSSAEKLSSDIYKFTKPEGLEVYVLYPKAKPPALTGRILTVSAGEARLIDAQQLQTPTQITYIVAGPESRLKNLQVKLMEALKEERMFQGMAYTLKKPTPKPRKSLAKIRPADLNGDGKVDREDLKVLREAYGLSRGKAGFKAEADLNSDGRIDIVDLAILASQFRAEKEKPPSKIVEEAGVEEKAGEGFKWTSNVTPGKGAAPGMPRGGPWNKRILLATSTDGIHWNKTYRILADQASVPDVIVDRDGYLRVYYGDVFNLGLTVAISPDGGETWVYRKVEGLIPGWVDPDVVILPDGRYRLYASYMPLGGPQDKIVSAISEDGIVFTPEEGYRYHNPERTLADPDVFYFKGKWYMIVGPGLTLLESEDGLTFTEVGELPLRGSVSCTIPFGEGLRIYYHKVVKGRCQIYFSYTEDLKNWSTPELVLSYGEPGSKDQYGVEAPAVVKLSEESYFMAYVTFINPPFQAEGLPEEKLPKEEAQLVGPEEKTTTFQGFSLLEDLQDAEKICEGCYLLKYPDFTLYMIWKPCKQAKGAYSFTYGDTTFLFDNDKILKILQSETEDPKVVDKLKSRLEHMDNSVVLLVSDDGVNWEKTGITIAKAADVPDIMVDKEGNLRVYYVSYPKNKIHVAISKDAKSWSHYEIKGVEAGWADPEVLLVDGTYILYSNLGIARSEDGINFEKVSLYEQHNDPTVFKVEGKWYMIAGPGTVLYISEDGINFERVKELKLGGEVCDVMEKDGVLWLYCHSISKGGSRILLFKSMDGENWKGGETVYLSSEMVADPTVTYFQGKYYMALTEKTRE